MDAGETSNRVLSGTWSPGATPRRADPHHLVEPGPDALAPGEHRRARRRRRRSRSTAACDWSPGPSRSTASRTAGPYDPMTSRDQQLILEHEIGHVLGLDHVADPRQLMAAAYNGQDGLGTGRHQRARRRSTTFPAADLGRVGEDLFVRESRRERKARERWARDMHRALEELDRLDRQYGLGSMPSQELGARTARPGPAAPPGTAGTAPPRATARCCPACSSCWRCSSSSRSRARRPPASGCGGSSTRCAATSTYAFVLDGPDNRPVGWDPCEPIHYVVNPEGAPDNWEDVVDNSVAEVEDASGFDFTYDGETDDRTFGQRPIEDDGTHAVLIAWATRRRGAQAAGQGRRHRRLDAGPPGRQGPLRGRHRRPRRGGGRAMMFGGRSRAQELILAHELGHVLGPRPRRRHRRADEPAVRRPGRLRRGRPRGPGDPARPALRLTPQWWGGPARPPRRQTRPAPARPRDRVRDLVDPGDHGEHAFLIDARNGGGVGWDPCRDPASESCRC